MWINMNESILAIIVGSILGCVFIVLPALIIRAVYRKFRAAKEKARLETQTGMTQKQPPRLYKPASPQRAMLISIGMTLLVIVWGVLTGFVVGVVSHLLYIVFLFPLGMGINSGNMIADAIQRVKIRKPWQLILLSILSAVTIYGTFHYTRYLGFQLQASLEIFQGFSEATETENLQAAKAFMDYALKEETGHPGFVGYMLYRASEGVSIGRISRSSSINLGSILTWFYWIMEFGIIFGVTIRMGKTSLRKPVCESCGNWLRTERHLGGTAPANEPFLLDLVKQKDFIGLGNLMEKNAEVPSLEIYFQGCEVCGQSQSHLVVRHATQTAKGGLQFTDASQTILQPKESALLLSQLSLTGN